jgi:glycosyltransferase involved in cell wall biosynthesis
VVLNAYACGGTTRTVVNQANALCGRHDVEIASVFRHRETPGFAIDPRVRMVPLTELRTDGTRRSDPPGTPSRLMNKTRRFPSPMPHRHDRRFRRWDPAVDVRLLRYLRAANDGVLITTRPGFNLLSARVAPRRLIRVAQDHMNLGTYEPRLHQEILRTYPKLDAVVVLTEHDRQAYRQAFGSSGLRLERIPNGVPEAHLAPAALDGKVLLAAGRLLPQKGFDMLLDAFAPVAAKHTDWQLQIFGAGPRHAELADQIKRLGLTGRAHLKGLTAGLDEQFRAASMFVLSSRYEGLPMVLLEAMTAGVPSVAFDCPTGPAEIIDHGTTGLLVPPEDVAALTAGICELIENPEKRRALGSAALESSRRYSIAAVSKQWDDLFTDLQATREA